MKTVVKRLIEQSTSIEEHGWGASGEVFDREKFAKLIVKECGNWIVDNAASMEHLGPEYFSKAMKEYFGVEE